MGKSGLPQISHVLAAAVVGFSLLVHPYLRWKRGWILGAGFAYYATLVGLVVFALYGDVHTLLSPLYYIFDFIIFVYLVNISANLGKPFIGAVFWIHIAQLILLTLLNMFGVSRYYGNGRFMGFFLTTPNQMGELGVMGRYYFISNGKGYI